jgi:hypothetical protein
MEFNNELDIELQAAPDEINNHPWIVFESVGDNDLLVLLQEREKMFHNLRQSAVGMPNAPESWQTFGDIVLKRITAHKELLGIDTQMYTLAEKDFKHATLIVRVNHVRNELEHDNERGGANSVAFRQQLEQAKQELEAYRIGTGFYPGNKESEPDKA